MTYTQGAPSKTISRIRCDGCSRVVETSDPQYALWISVLGPTDLSAGNDLTPTERGPSDACSWRCLHTATADLAEADL
jgi:hypothetical protein